MLRTVHHVDDFTSPSLIECQDRSILEPDHVVCVSRAVGASACKSDFGVTAGLVSNGVDPRRFRPPRDRAERALARRLAGVEDRFAVLTVGGVEPRKGSITLLEGFAKLRETVPDALLVIAGGTTLFDYRAELERFAERADQLGVTEHVWRLGALESEELERLFRAADVFAFPSVKEGFGLVALEAIAAGLPLVASDLDVFRGYLTDGESRAADPGRRRRRARRTRSRASSSDRALRTRLRAGGRAVVAQHTWDASAERARARLRAASRSRDGGDRDVPRRLLRDGHRARSHGARSTSRRPSGGNDDGFMPTELLFGGLASCFALALGHAARKRDVDLPEPARRP